jgi:hypothetical protein
MRAMTTREPEPEVIGSVSIPARFCGPPDRGNGGMTAGLLADYAGGPAEVTLRRPSPLEMPLTVAVAGDTYVLLDGDALIAEAVRTEVVVDPPVPPTVDEAHAAAASSPIVRHPDWHPFPGCFVCGPERAPGDGLRVLPGRLAGREVFAAPVSVPGDLADAEGRVPSELMWAALDCPSSFVMYMDGRPDTPYVLGRIAARIDRRPVIDSVLVACSWPMGRDGRKLFAASALYEGAELVACARATWISI